MRADTSTKNLRLLLRRTSPILAGEVWGSPKTIDPEAEANLGMSPLTNSP